jgi:hypothetical protein
MSETVAKPEPKFAVFVALDWGDREHAWVLEVAGSGEREHGKLEQTPEAIDAWAAELAVRWEGRLIAVGLEQARGALIYSLAEVCAPGAVPDSSQHQFVLSSGDFSQRRQR